MLILPALLLSCQSIQYYAQAVGGHASIMLKQRKINDVLADPSMDAKISARLRHIQSVRAFASTQLMLPDNESYARYADIKREFVVWNVVATPRYSVEPVESCFWVVGCVSYRGYYKKAAALKKAEAFRLQGLDVYVGGVGAYSTLGWFADPVLNTMLNRSDVALSELIFHELAHQQLFIKNDTQFNESFATAVAEIGLRQWAQNHTDEDSLQAYFEQKKRRAAIVKLILNARDNMRDAYAAYPAGDEGALSKIKLQHFDEIKAQYQMLRDKGEGTPGFTRFFESDLNHASLALFGEYHGWVEAFEQLFAQANKSWPQFYEAVSQLSRLSFEQREQQLSGLTGL